MINIYLSLFLIFIGVVLKTFKTLYIVKATPLKASIISGFTQVISVVSIKFIIDYTTWWAITLLIGINIIGVYITTLYFNFSLNKKVLASNTSEISELDDAIEHCKVVANAHKCDQCGQNHLQLGNWLRELKNLKYNKKAYD